MLVWLLEFSSDGWDDMKPIDAYLTERKALRAVRKIIRKHRKLHKIKINLYSMTDGTHHAAWGDHRLKLYPVRLP